MTKTEYRRIEKALKATLSPEELEALLEGHWQQFAAELQRTAKLASTVVRPTE